MEMQALAIRDAQIASKKKAMRGGDRVRSLAESKAEQGCVGRCLPSWFDFGTFHPEKSQVFLSIPNQKMHL